MAPWQPETQPWRKPTSDVLKKINSGTASQTHVLAVLHCSTADYDSMVPFITDQLSKEGIQSTDTLGSTARRQTTKKIAMKLLNDPDHDEKLHWAIHQGEEEEVVVNALCAAIRGVHTASKRRTKRIKSEPQEESASTFAPSSQAGSPHPSSTSPSKTQIKREASSLQSPVKTESEHTTTSRQQLGSSLVKLTIPGNTQDDLGLKHIIAISRALTDEEKYRRIQDEIRRKLPNPAQAFMLAEYQSDGSKCICDDPTTFAALLDEHDLNGSKMSLVPLYTYSTRSGQFKPPPVDSNLGTITY